MLFTLNPCFKKKKNTLIFFTLGNDFRLLSPTTSWKKTNKKKATKKKTPHGFLEFKPLISYEKAVLKIN